MDQQVARAQLTSLLADLDQSASTLAGEDAGESSELSHLDQHPADTASELSDQDREDALLEVVSGQRAEVLAALRRLDESTYGRCVTCGKDLPDERLAARPEAARCVECQTKSEVDR